MPGDIFNIPMPGLRLPHAWQTPAFTPQDRAA